MTERDDERLLPASRGTPPPKHHPLKKLNTQTSLDLHELANSELSLKASLYFHISNPIKRWKVERLVPIKLLLQLLKTAVFIIQVHLSALSIIAPECIKWRRHARAMHADYVIKFRTVISLVSLCTSQLLLFTMINLDTSHVC